MKKTSFEDFTNLYELSKTLRFELKPIGNTARMLKDNQVFEKDKVRKTKYEQLRVYFDRLHREFVKESLENISLEGLDKYWAVYQEWQKDKKNNKSKKALQEQEKNLRKQIISFFNAKGKEYSEEYSFFKKKDKGILFEDSVFQLLKAKYGEEKKTKILVIKQNDEGNEVECEVSIFDEWKGFTGYFTKFFETRKNFYKDDGTSTAIATRIIDQNLKRYCDNLREFAKIAQKLDLSGVEENFDISLNDVFSLGYYNNCVLQTGIDLYNRILGGETLKNGEKLKGINEVINKYRQDHKGERDAKLPFLKPLDKQILSEKEKFIKVIENKEELLQALKSFADTTEVKINQVKNLISNFVNNNEKYSLDKIYISKKGFETISRRWASQTHVFEQLLFAVMKGDKPTGLKYDKKEDTYKFPDFIAIAYIKEALEQYIESGRFWKDHYYQEEDNHKGCITDEQKIWQQFLLILWFEFSSLFERKVRSNETKATHSAGYNTFRKDFIELISEEEFEVNKNSKVIIKNFADNVLWIYQMAKYFAVEKKRNWVTEYELCDVFYSAPETGYLEYYDNAYENIVKVYNDLRNYLTKKPWEEVQKWKLNFENSTLADGWDKNKEKDNTAVILRKDGRYYLGLMKKGCNQIFADRNIEEMQKDVDQGKYEKMVYKYFPDQAKMFPKVCFSKKGLDFFKPSDEIYRIYKNLEYKKGESFSLSSMHKLIDFYKSSLTKYDGWKCYTFSNLKPTVEYQGNIGEFYSDVAKNGYRVWFEDISEKYINEKNQNGELYLFQIYNKDFELDESIAPDGYHYKGKTGKKNLHTMYFENLFSDYNKERNFILKLNGQAEIFFRQKAIDENKVKRNFKWEIVEKKRYTKDKVFFHCPITLNRGKGKTFGFNREMNGFLSNNPEINVIGIDRGEKHIAYFSVIDQKGVVLDRGSLNFVRNQKADGTLILKNEKEIKEIRDDDGKIIDYELVETGVKVEEEDYKLLLEYKEKKRKVERQSWQEVEGIKDLKRGYISQVVRKLADLAIEHNAIIVFEDLNMRFKQIRGGIEKSAYQQLEKALIEKLSYLVNKGEKDPKEAGHLLRAYQFAAPFESFKAMGKQTGIIFYTTAAYTSKIDPLSGWRKNVYLKYTNAKKAKEDISKFTDIRFNKEKDRFEFTYDLQKFVRNKDAKLPEKTKWTLCSCVERWKWNRGLNSNKGGYEYYQDLTDKLKELFDHFEIGIDQDIKNQIKALECKGNEQFFRKLIYFWNLVCQIRNTNPDKEGNDNDIILSPVEPFFDSRRSGDFGDNLPKNGDDNGAYNIARKGIIVLNKISDFEKENGGLDKLKWGDIYVSNVDWDNYAQSSE